MDSILNTVKSALGISIEETSFDTDLIITINTIIFTLKQLGVSTSSDFVVTSAEESWTSLIGQNPKLEAIKSYVSLRVKLIFDPPNSSYAIASYERVVAELEWRIVAQLETLAFNPDLPPLI